MNSIKNIINSSQYNLITIIGPTAGGKTSVAAELAYLIDGEIISGDSRQVYRGMSIGTGKDLNDYVVNGRKIPYHLIDIVEPGYKLNVFEFQQHFLNAYNDITTRKKMPILCGGSGLYVEAAIKGYKLIAVPVNSELRQALSSKSLEELEIILSSYKKLHNKTDIDTKKRAIRAIEIEDYYSRNTTTDLNYPHFKNLIIGIVFPRDVQRKRITQRLKQRLGEGMIDEVHNLISSGISPDDLIYYGLEYKWITKFVIGEISYNDMFNGLNIAIHQFAKRQLTWFRRMERNGFPIHWIDGELAMSQKIDSILNLLNSKLANIV